MPLFRRRNSEDEIITEGPDENHPIRQVSRRGFFKKAGKAIVVVGAMVATGAATKSLTDDIKDDRPPPRPGYPEDQVPDSDPHREAWNDLPGPEAPDLIHALLGNNVNGDPVRLQQILPDVTLPAPSVSGGAAFAIALDVVVVYNAELRMDLRNGVLSQGLVSPLATVNPATGAPKFTTTVYPSPVWGVEGESNIPIATEKRNIMTPQSLWANLQGAITTKDGSKTLDPAKVQFRTIARTWGTQGAASPDAGPQPTVPMPAGTQLDENNILIRNSFNWYEKLEQIDNPEATLLCPVMGHGMIIADEYMNVNSKLKKTGRWVKPEEGVPDKMLIEAGNCGRVNLFYFGPMFDDNGKPLATNGKGEAIPVGKWDPDYMVAVYPEGVDWSVNATVNPRNRIVPMFKNNLLHTVTEKQFPGISQFLDLNARSFQECVSDGWLQKDIVTRTNLQYPVDKGAAVKKLGDSTDYLAAPFPDSQDDYVPEAAFAPQPITVLDGITLPGGPQPKSTPQPYLRTPIQDPAFSADAKMDAGNGLNAYGLPAVSAETQEAPLPYTPRPIEPAGPTMDLSVLPTPGG